MDKVQKASPDEDIKKWRDRVTNNFVRDLVLLSKEQVQEEVQKQGKSNVLIEILNAVHSPDRATHLGSIQADYIRYRSTCELDPQYKGLKENGASRTRLLSALKQIARSKADVRSGIARKRAKDLEREMQENKNVSQACLNANPVTPNAPRQIAMIDMSLNSLISQSCTACSLNTSLF
jgi:hypothetical protein